MKVVSEKMADVQNNSSMQDHPPMQHQEVSVVTEPNANRTKGKQALTSHDF